METETLIKKKIQAVPELRFREFQEGWTRKKLGELGQFRGGGTPDTKIEKYWMGDIPWISSSDLAEDDIHNIKIQKWINKEAVKETATKIIPKDSILLISRVGVGKLAISKEDICTSQDFSNFLPINANSYYLGYYLIARKNLLLAFSQGTSIKGFTTSDIKNLILNLPSLPEQQKIASFLSAVDKKIHQLTRKKELLETYKEGVMQKLFSQEIRFKGEDGKDFPEWEENKLGEIATFSKGKGVSKNDIFEDGSVSCIRYGELYTHYNETIEQIYSKTNLAKEDLILSEAGDVIIPASGETRLDIATASCLLQEGIALGGDLNIIRGGFNGVFLAYFLNNHLKTDIARLSQGSSVIHLYSNQLKKLKLKIPSNQEQQKIADFLSAIDRKIGAVSQQIEKTKAFKKGLLQQMFV